ncbi:hypothetical protein ARMSODRAFT_184140 [Armillaria solidipes]|uniref:Uncharacterized protein n=1 Tax=Armillaria solidipes TaxID=1076256 RepID=A0A2H3B300_9AGAR|nr:hypothetical protein ARMSODRAFT_184140 [Armillaria solidipes]
MPVAVRLFLERSPVFIKIADNSRNYSVSLASCIRRTSFARTEATASVFVTIPWALGVHNIKPTERCYALYHDGVHTVQSHNSFLASILPLQRYAQSNAPMRVIHFTAFESVQ